MSPAAWAIRCVRRPWEVVIQAQVIQNAVRPKATNGTRCWTRTADISKTGIKCIRGDRILFAFAIVPCVRAGYIFGPQLVRNSAPLSNSSLGFRPVLEVLNPDTLGSDGLKAVTLDLDGGKLGGSSDAIHIIVKTGSELYRACVRRSDPPRRKYRQLLRVAWQRWRALRSGR